MKKHSVYSHNMILTALGEQFSEENFFQTKQKCCFLTIATFVNALKSLVMEAGDQSLFDPVLQRPEVEDKHVGWVLNVGRAITGMQHIEQTPGAYQTVPPLLSVQFQRNCLEAFILGRGNLFILHHPSDRVGADLIMISRKKTFQKMGTITLLLLQPIFHYGSTLSKNIH